MSGFARFQPSEQLILGERLGFGWNCLQLVTCFGSELGVERQNFDGERYLVGDALTGSVSTRKQFEVLVPVVRSNTIDVVDGFFRSKLSSKFPLHPVAVFENLARRFAVFSCDVDSHIAVASEPGFGNSVDVGFLHANSLPQAAAFGAAYDASSSAITFVKSECFGALGAFSVDMDTSSFSAAFDRAVHWSAAVFLHVAAKLSRLPAKRFFALLTGEICYRSDVLQSAVVSFVCAVAGSAAKSYRGFVIFGFEVDAALRAAFARHVVSFVKRRKFPYHVPDRMAMAEIAGVA